MFDYWRRVGTHCLTVLFMASLVQEIAAAFKQVDEKTGADRDGWWWVSVFWWFGHVQNLEHSNDKNNACSRHRQHHHHHDTSRTFFNNILNCWINYLVLECDPYTIQMIRDVYIYIYVYIDGLAGFRIAKHQGATWPWTLPVSLMISSFSWLWGYPKMHGL